MTTVAQIKSPSAITDADIATSTTEINKSNALAVFTARDWDRIPQLQKLPVEMQYQMKAVAQVLPLRLNRYLIDNLINWDNIPADPIFQLTFPQPDMLDAAVLSKIVELAKSTNPAETKQPDIGEIRTLLNPATKEYTDQDIPELDGRKLQSVQHKYRESIMFFPNQSHTCHSCCTYCDGWGKINSGDILANTSAEANDLITYLAQNKQANELWVSGCDPMMMSAQDIGAFLSPLLDKSLEHILAIRLESSALTFCPHRFVSEKDTDDLLQLFEKLVKNGKHLVMMANYYHWQEIESDISRTAIRRILDTGATIKSQGTLIAKINGNPDTWTRLWTRQLNLGIIPTELKIQRDTGNRQSSKVTLANAWQIYRDAIQRLPAPVRTVHGPCMDTGPGKVEIQGITEINSEKVFALQFIQGRNPEWTQKPFFAQYNENATWLNDLVPAFGKNEFFFEKEYRQMCSLNKWRDSIR